MVANHRLFLALALTLFLSSATAFADAILFDASKHEMAGNADWVIDADVSNLNMQAYPCTGTTNESNPGRYPTPDQGGITPSTPQTYWRGGISAWAVELVKAGHTVESLPDGAAITFGDGSNPQDLSNYDLFIVPEPQNPFTASEKAAILAFVNAGGGLFMVADHETSDRDCDGWDSPWVFNDLTGASGTTITGVFGIWFRVDGLQVKGEDWFDDGVDNNVTTDPLDPIIHGPFGDGSGGLGFFGATSMDINPLDNATVKAHVWRTGQAHNDLRVTFATAEYGAGRVAAIGDSSPADDNSGDPGDTLYPGWDLASGGVNNREIHLNACHWLLNPTPDTTPPTITGGPGASPADCSATVTWTTDEAATSSVAYGPTTSYGSTASTPGHATAHSVVISGLSPLTTYHYQASSTDPSGNGPAQSADAIFTTLAGTAPTIAAGPTAGTVGGTSATITWTTDEAATSEVEYGLTASYGNSASTAGYATSQSVTVTGLTPETLYHYQVHSTDSCANGPTSSADETFTTGPASLDISGWVLKQFNSTQTFTIPAGTTIPSGGYLVLGREATRAEFEAAHPTLPASAVYLNSNASGSCSDGCFPLINGSETFELWNGTTKVDGTTIAMSSSGGNAYQRKNPGDPPGVAGSWTTVAMANANPGQGAGTGAGVGVIINEMADASSWPYEFIELYYDAGAPQTDTTPPDAVADLSALALSDTQIRLSWTAPGDDGSTGTAAAYDVRRSPNPITSDGEFSAATPVPGAPVPSGAGSPEQFVVTGLTASTTYHFAVKTRDEVPNWSSLSNSPSATTLTSTDVTPPAPITNLVATPVTNTIDQVQLTWTAPGDDGNAGTLVGVGSYDIYRKATRILTPADLAGATLTTFTPAKAPGLQESVTVTGLSADTPYYFAVRAKDEVPNLAGLSNGASATTGNTVGGGSFADHLVISQFQTSGDGGADDEFVEIYNPTEATVPLAGWSLQYHNTSTTGSFVRQNIAGGSVPSHGYFLIARSVYNGSPGVDLTNTGFSMGAAAATLFLVNNQTLLSSCSASSIVDKVAYGSGAFHCPEGTATAAPTANDSIQRKPGATSGSGTDTDNNSADFQSLSPSVPHNSSSTPATPPPSTVLGNVGPTLYFEGASTADLGWANAANATGGYRVYRGTTPDFKTPPNSPPPWQTVATNSVTDSATPPPIFFYVIRATDGTGESAD